MGWINPDYHYLTVTSDAGNESSTIQSKRRIGLGRTAAMGVQAPSRSHSVIPALGGYACLTACEWRLRHHRGVVAAARVCLSWCHRGLAD